ncbi:hypothetical protein [Rhizobium sp. Leaf386]|uniref:hypothetical protein n=1 Tax=Rhizobium sp. Leaf386 TaxID=1736359 RepID=UPI0007125411|nr:hypothetical protein [Rhizobium sp. Leaf386]KQS96699.1 hypothetical protein ASG50_06600 [Rhizobium sp. Leaf386]
MALKTSIIHCLVDAEPESYHATPSLAVNLGFECPTDISRGDVIGEDDGAKTKRDALEGDEDLAKARFEAFLADARVVEFHLFEALLDNPADPSNCTLTHLGVIDKTSEAPAAGMPEQVIDWLGNAKPQDPKVHYWSTFAGTEPEAPINAETAPATYRLRAAHSWNAPVAHRLGLTHILRPPAMTEPHYVVLPFFSAPAEPLPDISGIPVSSAAGTDLQWDFAYHPGGTLDEAICRTVVLDTKDLFVFPKELQDVLAPEGYLKVDAEAENLWRITNWFEARATSLMSVTETLAGPDTDVESVKAFDKLFPLKIDETTAPPTLIAPAAAWLATTSLITAFDATVLSILKPVAGKDSAGEVIAPLLIDLLDRIEATIADPFDLKVSDLQIDTLTSSFRLALKAGNPFFMQANNLPVQPSRKAITDLLKSVHSIDAKAKDASFETRLLDVLLQAFEIDAAPPIPTDLKTAIANGENALLRRALAETVKRLQDEAGAEGAIIRLLEGTVRSDGIRLPRLFAEAYLVHIQQAGNTALLSAVENAFDEAWAAYRTLLESPFNGAEAVRSGAAGEFSKALMGFAKARPIVPPPEPAISKPQHLIDVAGGAEYYFVRLFPFSEEPDPFNPIACFRSIAGSLLRTPPMTGFDPAGIELLKQFFMDAYSAAIAPMADVIDQSARFIPDAAPAPLPIQIASNIDGAEIDMFARHFNGIGLAIRRIDTDDASDRWTHASLADLTWPLPPPPKPGQPDVPPTFSGAIHPFLPAISDGRAPMFVAYEGLPLAAATFGRTAADLIPEATGRNASFYIHEAPDLETAAEFVKVPRLAYGRKFEAFSFATTNAGSLPLALQRQAKPPEAPSTTVPWMPGQDIDPPRKDGAIDPSYVLTKAYQRRTAIGQITLEEIPTVNRSRRIGAPIKGVVPVSQDYPRTVIASAGSPGVLDIFRDRDGAGILDIPNPLKQMTEWRLGEAVIRGKPSKISVRLFDKAPTGPDDPGIAGIDLEFAEGFDFGLVDRLTFRVAPGVDKKGAQIRQFSATCGSITKSATIGTDNAIEAGWIRLSLASTAPASLSFAVTDELKPYDVGAPLLMLAPDDDAWKGDVRDPVTVDIITPRVGYLDFDRWFSNADLRDTAFRDPKTGKVDTAAADRLRRALLTAYVLRDADEALAGALDRLPDPAVDGLRIELAIQDQLAASDPPFSFAQADVLFGQRLLAIAAKIKSGQSWTPKLLMDLVFLPIETAFRYRIRLTEGNFGLASNGSGASVPAGIAVRLSISSLVANRHFNPAGKHPAVFHKGLCQHAPRAIVQAGTGAVFLAFPSVALRIETMLNGIPDIDVKDKMKPADKPAIALAADMIAVRPIDRTRRYDLQTRAGLPAAESKKRTRQWRLLGEIDVTTQRWRPSGKPIYHHIDPFAFRDDTVLSDPPSPRALHAAMPLREKPGANGYPLSRFEQEAFFDRPNVDSQTITQRLLPLPSRTVLEEHFWEAPSASYFRHRFTLRSRYAGALKAVSHQEVKAWNTDRQTRRTPADAWTLRIAMLADLTRLLLTRPQQRALIPLTSAPRDDGDVPSAPPVLAILQEPPFSRGGLADRIAAEIKTGFGYGFEDVENAAVEILDSRKEIGPDPRLTYRPTDHDTALGMALDAEGPIGLTFDPVNSPAPAFPNSMISLSPVQLSGEKQNLEEHFLGVSMRRYIDPHWTIGDEAPDPLDLDAERCWWIGHGPATEPRVLLSYTSNGIETPLLTLTNNASFHVVHVMKAAIDGVAGAKEKDVAIARWNAGISDRLSLLHQPVAPGRYSTSVFVNLAQNKDEVKRGRGNAPLLICNFEWGPPTGTTEDKVAETKGPATVRLKAGNANARLTMASAATFLAWTRMGRNFDIAYSPDFTLSAETPRELLTRKLQGIVSDDATLTLAQSGSGETWLCASTFQKPYPLHVQRHLAVLTTGYLREPGRPLEQYSRSALCVGRQSSRLSGTGDREDCLRLVEFETPSSILCSHEVVAPETYRKAYFDLVATGFRQTSGPASARLFFRFAGTGEHLRKFTTLKIMLAYGTGNADGALTQHAVAVSLGNTKEAFATAVELFVERQDENAKLSYRSAVVMSDGEMVSASYPAPGDEHGLLGADNHNPGFFVSLTAEGKAGAGEFWTDVSLLHAARPTFDGRFDFGWLFSNAGGAEPALDVAPAGLNAMVEAQARIIAVSPPIPIQQKPVD